MTEKKKSTRGRKPKEKTPLPKKPKKPVIIRATVPEQAKRDSLGRWQKGTAPGPGRPPKEREKLYLSIIENECTPSVWAKVVKRAIKDATLGQEGSTRSGARKWLSDYLLGLPVQRIAPTDPSGENEYSGAADAELLAIASSVLQKITTKLEQEEEQEEDNDQ